MRDVILFGTKRHAVAVNDFFAFFSQSKNYRVAKILLPGNWSSKMQWLRTGKISSPQRNNWLYPMPIEKVEIYETPGEAIRLIQSLPDAVIATGNGNDDTQLKLREELADRDWIFSEYGWIPWSGAYYMDPVGVGEFSSISKLEMSDIKLVDVSPLTKPRDWNHGVPLEIKNYCYIPLQKDYDDFKTNSSPFHSNLEFLKLVREITPIEIKMVIRQHPHNPRRINVEKIPNSLDISDKKISKNYLYENMDFLINVNGTSAIEALCFAAPIFSYGRDVYSGCGLVNPGPTTSSQLLDSLNRSVDLQARRRFISLLLERQVVRDKLSEKNSHQYVANHYWNQI